MATKKSDKKVTSRNLGVILENIDSKVEQVLEGHSSLDKKIEDFRHETKSEVGFLRFSQDLLLKNVKDINIKMDRLEDKNDKSFKQILDYLSQIDKEIQDLKSRLVNKADVERLVRLEQKVVQIELVVKKWQK
ncbi:MAG: hypothetical protein Q8L24_01525 [bacterium]|nr:hypothetical protein [bacterium]